MKYRLNIEVPERPPITQINFDVPVVTAREFKRITKQVLKTPMSKVMTDMMNQFIEEHQSRGQLKQESFL
jgi:hypothetical protein